jgi:hypothetical protein
LRQDVTLIDDDVANVADTELGSTIFGNIGVARRHAPLNIDSAADRVDRAWEFDESAIAGCLDHAATMLCNFRIEEFASDRLEHCESALLVDRAQCVWALRHTLAS